MAVGITEIRNGTDILIAAVHPTPPMCHRIVPLVYPAVSL